VVVFGFWPEMNASGAVAVATVQKSHPHTIAGAETHVTAVRQRCVCVVAVPGHSNGLLHLPDCS
jgi:hypothetical protein